MRRLERRWLAFLLVCGCAGGDAASNEPFDVALGTPEVVVSLESELIGHPTDLALDHTGRLWIADSRSHRILVVEPDGGVAFMIDREGDGPGELRRPAVVEVRDTTVRVLDSGTMRVQDYTLTGVHIGDRPFAAPMLGERDSPPALYVLDRDTGAVLGRMTVATPAPPNGFVVDRARDRLYVSIPDEASTLAVSLPFEVNRLYRAGEHAETS